MSRHGYTDECDDVLAMGRWQGALNSAIRGRRGQAMLRELAAALDAMPVRELHSGIFATPEGEYCALGVLGASRGIDMSHLALDPDAEPDVVAAIFGVAETLAREVMWRNDDVIFDDEHVFIELCGPMRGYHGPYQPGRAWPERHRRQVLVPVPDAPARRWRSVRAWVAEQIAGAARSKQ